MQEQLTDWREVLQPKAVKKSFRRSIFIPSKEEFDARMRHALAQVERGEVHTHHEVKAALNSWLRKL